VEKFLESKNTSKFTDDQMREYIEKVALYEAAFASQSPADQTMKSREPRKGIYRCADGHRRTIDDRPVFICD